MNHSDRFSAMVDEQERARREGVAQLLGEEGPVGDMVRSTLRDVNERLKGDGEWQEMLRVVDRLCQEIEDMYKNTDATASQCFDRLNEELPQDIEADCIGLWQTLLRMVEEEEEWDKLSPEEQANMEHVPKGKQRKPVKKESKRKRTKKSTASSESVTTKEDESKRAKKSAASVAKIVTRSLKKSGKYS